MKHGLYRNNYLELLKRHLYVMATDKLAPTKIGISVDVNVRLKQLHQEGYEGLKLIAVFECEDAILTEMKVHRKLARHEIGKEWFDVNALEAVLMIEDSLLLKPQFIRN